MKEKLNAFGIIASDKIAEFGGSWRFLISFTIALTTWIVYNLSCGKPFDPYPFILLNLMFSALAAYQAPIILMAANRQASKDRLELDKDLQITEATHEKIEQLELKIQTQLEEIKQLLANRG